MGAVSRHLSSREETVNMEYTRERLQQMADSLPFWWNSIDLGHGVKTKGVKAGEDMTKELKVLCLPELRGKTVLDKTFRIYEGV